MTRAGRDRLPRDLHPVAWWLWAIGSAAAASFTTNPLLLATILASVTLVVTTHRSAQPWGRSFRTYVWLGVVIVLVRVLFRVLLGGQDGGPVLLALPGIPLPHWVLGVTLLGPLTRDALLAGAYDGLRLATIVICVGAANSLANPKRLLRAVPPALYEVGTALVVAITVLPQFADSARHVRAAQHLREGDTRRRGRLRRFVVPVLEDALERSLALAAGMDTRGYGRSGSATPAQRRTTGTLMLAGLLGVCVGTYAVLDPTAPRIVALPLLLGGLALAAAGTSSAGRRVVRTRYRPDPWRRAETLVVLGGAAVAVVLWWVSHHDLAIAYPGLDAVPAVSILGLVGALLGASAALSAPPPREVVA